MPPAKPHAFHGLEIPLRVLSGARAVRIVHPPHQVIGEHRHDWPLLTIPTLGGYEEESDDGSIAVAGPAVILHPPGRCHANCIHSLGMETFSIEFDPAWLGLSRRDPLFQRSFYWIGGTVPLASRALARRWNAAGQSEQALRKALSDFLRAAISAEATACPAWLGTVQRHVSQHPSTTARELAQELGMHPRWLAHAYRLASGEGLHDTILRRRIEHAAHLLRTTHAPIAEIALAAGFCDQSHLNRALGRFTGRTPSQLRAEGASLDALFETAVP